MRTRFPRSLLLLRSEPPIAQRPRRIYALAGLYFRTTPVISQPPFIFIFPPSLLTILLLAEPVMSPMVHVPSPLTPPSLVPITVWAHLICVTDPSFFHWLFSEPRGKLTKFFLFHIPSPRSGEAS